MPETASPPKCVSFQPCTHSAMVFAGVRWQNAFHFSPAHTHGDGFWQGPLAKCVSFQPCTHTRRWFLAGSVGKMRFISTLHTHTPRLIERVCPVRPPPVGGRIVC